MFDLAINGGRPIRESYLAYGKQWIDDNDIKAVIDVLKSDYLTTGPYVRKFEQCIADYVGAKYAVALCNGTAALHAACFAAEIEKDDEVIVSPMTFAASANCVLYCGGKPVFCDIDPKTYNIDINQIEAKISNRTKAIIPVDFSGQSVDMDGIRKIADKYGLVIIEDGAHALGSEYKGEKVGNKADMTEFSFHPVKPVTTGEGGIVTTNNEVYYKRLELFRTHGIIRNRNQMSDYQGPWYYEQLELGYNYRLTDIECALGYSQMSRIEEFIARRRNIVKIYNEEIENISQVIIPYEEGFSNSGWHIYIIKLKLNELKVGRREIFEALQAENIGVNVHYMPVYLHPYYKKLGYEKGICPQSESLYESMITLPLFPKMGEQDIYDVVNALKKVIKHYSK